VKWMALAIAVPLLAGCILAMKDDLDSVIIELQVDAKCEGPCDVKIDATRRTEEKKTGSEAKVSR